MPGFEWCDLFCARSNCYFHVQLLAGFDTGHVTRAFCRQPIEPLFFPRFLLPTALLSSSLPFPLHAVLFRVLPSESYRPSPTVRVLPSDSLLGRPTLGDSAEYCDFVPVNRGVY